METASRSSSGMPQWSRQGASGALGESCGPADSKLGVTVSMVGLSAPYREAVEQRLVERGLPQLTTNEAQEVVMIQCDSSERWELLKTECARRCVVIAVLPEPILDDYVSALAAGAGGVVSGETSSTITVDVIEAALHGEVVLPRHAAQCVALLAQRLKVPSQLDCAEAELLKAVAAGITIVDLAQERFFSERTVRRHLQSLYLKLGVRNRSEAIAAAVRMGLVD